MSNEIIILEDKLHPDGVCRVHLMSNKPIEYPLPPGVDGKRSVDAGAHTLRAEWRYRDVCDIVIERYDWRRRVVLWALESGDRISKQAVMAANLYWRLFGMRAEYAWVRKMPAGVEIGEVIQDDENEIALLCAWFVPPGFLAVGNGGRRPELISL